jgi:hypothetical protein
LLMPLDRLPAPRVGAPQLENRVLDWAVMLLLRSTSASAKARRGPGLEGAFPPEPGRPLRTVTTALLLGITTFVVVGAGLRQLAWDRLGMPYMEVMTEKLDHYNAHAAKYNTIVVGSSRVFRSIDPRAVEAAAAEHGCPSISVFNFGIPSLSHSEQTFLLKRILADRSDNLQRVIFEDALHETRDYANATTPRGRYFHSVKSIYDKLNNIWSYPEALSKRLYRTQIFLRAFLFENSGIGLLSQLALGKKEEEQPAVQLSLEHAGFLALDEDPDERLRERRKEFLENIEFFDDMVALKHGIVGQKQADRRARYLIEQARHLEFAGVNVGLIVPPNPSTLRFTPGITGAVRQQAPDVTVFDYNRKSGEPDIFQHSLWFDLNHLTKAGANTISIQFGADLCAAIQAGKI